MYRIAVCEDDKNNRQLVLNLLAECCGDEYLMDTYEEASDLLSDWMQKGRRLQDILLMDIKFRDEDGISVVKEFWAGLCDFYDLIDFSDATKNEHGEDYCPECGFNQNGDLNLNFVAG